jgi:hypothetical protein
LFNLTTDPLCPKRPSPSRVLPPSYGLDQAARRLGSQVSVAYSAMNERKGFKYGGKLIFMEIIDP